MRLGWWAVLMMAAGCTGTTSDKEVSTDPFYDFIDLEETAERDTTGDFSCFTAGTAWDEIAWLTQTPDPSKVDTWTVHGEVNDFEKDTPVDEGTVSLWYGDVASGAPDDIDTIDFGNVGLEAPSCQPLSYKTAPPEGFDETKVTYKAHQVYGPPDGEGLQAEYLSVSRSTYQVIPSILGVEVDPTKAIIAGTAFDCTRAPDEFSEVDDGKVVGAQVIVRDEDGNIPEGLVVKYFIEDFPDRDQHWTSPDGLWIAINVPPGRLRVEMWGLVGGELQLLGATWVQSYADSINIGNIFGGYGEGVKYPDSCVTEG